eukprot:m.245299 g.245299  ORF g.245299 m.245299 type:complete len:501 (-) comp15365_c1_seq3:183-1685(-)
MVEPFMHVINTPPYSQTPLGNGDGGIVTDAQHSILKDMMIKMKPFLKPFHSERFVVRYLIAQNFHEDPAIAMLKRHLEWRESVGADAGIDELRESIPPHVQTYCPPPQLTGETRAGNPLYFDCPGRLDVAGVLKACVPEDIVRYHGLVFMEQAYLTMKQQSIKHEKLVDKIVVVSDMGGWGMKQMTRPFLNIIGDITRVRTDNYPQILSKMIIINPPTIIGICWSLIKPFLRERTRKKIEIIKGNPSTRLQEIATPDNLPKRYGGTATDPATPGTIPQEFYFENQLKESVTIKKGHSHTISKEVSPGDTVKWQVLPQGRDIGFQVDHMQPSSSTPLEQIVAPARISPGVLQAGSHSCASNGTIEFKLDNSFSYIHSKTVRFNIDVQPAAAKPPVGPLRSRASLLSGEIATSIGEIPTEYVASSSDDEFLDPMVDWEGMPTSSTFGHFSARDPPAPRRQSTHDTADAATGAATDAASPDTLAVPQLNPEDRRGSHGYIAIV